MPCRCCAIGCINKQRKKAEGVTYYRFPKDEKLRKLWVKATRVGDWTPSENSRLCSAHFASGQKSTNPLNPDYVPSIFAHLSARQRERNIYKYERFKKTMKMKRKRAAMQDVLKAQNVKTNNMNPTIHDALNAQKTNQKNENSVNDSSTLVTQNPSSIQLPGSSMADEHSYCSTKVENAAGLSPAPCTNEICLTTVKMLNAECIALRTELYMLRDKVKRLSFSQEIFDGNDEKVLEMTGLPSYAKLMFVFSMVSGFLKARHHQMSPFQLFLMTLMRLKLNMPLLFLSHIFDISRSTASRVFTNTLTVMHDTLSRFIAWPSRTVTSEVNKNVTSVIGCFELFIEPPNRKKICQVNSGQKGSMKYLIAIAPKGVIAFVSTGWEGKTSDGHIAENSGFLDNLSPGDVVLADQDFEIEDAVRLKGAHLITRHASSNQQPQPKEDPLTMDIDAVRVAVQFVRNKYTTLQGNTFGHFHQAAVPGQLTPLDKMVGVCCALCNICQSDEPLE